MSESHVKPLIIIARSYFNFKDYCAYRKINWRSRKETIFVSSTDRDSDLKIQGMLVKREQVIILDVPRDQLLKTLTIRTLRGEGMLEGIEFDEHRNAIIKHLSTEVDR